MNPSPLYRHVKRWSILPVATFDVLATVAAITLAAIGRGGLHTLAWLGAAIATAALPVQVVSFFGLKRGRTSRNLTVMTAVASVAAATAVGASLLTGTGWPASVAILGLLSTPVYAGQPTAFVFIRGNWCPLCVAQVRELAAEYQSLAARGIEVALISPQPLDETRSLAERFGVDFRYLTDPAIAQDDPGSPALNRMFPLWKSVAGD